MKLKQTFWSPLGTNTNLKTYLYLPNKYPEHYVIQLINIKNMSYNSNTIIQECVNIRDKNWTNRNNLITITSPTHSPLTSDWLHQKDTVRRPHPRLWLHITHTKRNALGELSWGKVALFFSVVSLLLCMFRLLFCWPLSLDKWHCLADKFHSYRITFAIQEVLFWRSHAVGDCAGAAAGHSDAVPSGGWQLINFRNSSGHFKPLVSVMSWTDPQVLWKLSLH